ncbi:MAG: O-antigen ligase family protein [Lachnospiraceae bacterium]|nr:O-antigen ligase family protein [Lachnospiraceae bacterium]
MRTAISKRNIFRIYIVLYPLLDIIYTLSEMFNIDIKINQLIRGAMLLYMFLCIRKQKHFFKTFIYSSWIIVSTFINIFVGYTTNAKTELTFSLKMITDIVVFYCFWEMLDNNIISTDDIFECMTKSSLIAAISVLLSYIGIGLTSYVSSARTGVKGFFTIQSSLTIYLLCMIPIIFVYKKKVFSIDILLVIIALFSIGSKAGVICTVIMLVFIILYTIRKKVLESNVNFKDIIITMIGTILIPTFGLYYLNQYITRLKTLYMYAGYYTGIYSFWLSNRNNQISAINLFLRNHNNGKLRGLLFGYGYTGVQYMMQKSRDLMAIERDFYGIYYYFGILILLITTGYLIYILYAAFKLNITERFKDDRYISMLYIWVMGIAYAHLGGHVMYEALGQFPFWIIGAMIVSEFKKKKMDIQTWEKV